MNRSTQPVGRRISDLKATKQKYYGNGGKEQCIVA